MKKKFFIGLFIVTSMALFVFAYLVLKPTISEYQPQQNLQAPIEIPEKSIMTYEEAVKIDKPMVVMFYVDWCGYCRKYMPTFAEFAKQYKDKYSFVAVNCDILDNIQLVKDFHIMGFPTVFVVDAKINHKFSVSMAAMSNDSVMQEELGNYIKVRKNFVK